MLCSLAKTPTLHRDTGTAFAGRKGNLSREQGAELLPEPGSEKVPAGRKGN